jgi:predicted nucleic acid-binding protein
VTPALLEQAKRLGRTHALRAYDAVQLAVALEASRYHRDKGSTPVILISADQALNDAATAEGLTAEDPNLHP